MCFWIWVCGCDWDDEWNEFVGVCKVMVFWLWVEFRKVDWGSWDRWCEGFLCFGGDVFVFSCC